MKTEIDVDRFFKDKDFKNLVDLTQEEAKAISEFESAFEYHNGFGSISGGFACIILEEFDEDTELTYDERVAEGQYNIILGHLKSGIQNDCENKVYTDQIRFNRKTKKVRIV